jgi:hypothetical protein
MLVLCPKNLTFHFDFTPDIIEDVRHDMPTLYGMEHLQFTQNPLLAV